MPIDQKLLAIELGKLAKLGAIQSGLPLILKGAPVVAIAAGGIVSQLLGKGEANAIEERLLGKEDVVTVLNAPQRQTIEAIHMIDHKEPGIGQPPEPLGQEHDRQEVKK